MIRDGIGISVRNDGVDCPVTAAFLLALKLKELAFYNHSVMVGLVAEQIGISLGLSQQKVRLIKLSGFLHDIGKLAIRNEILLKPSSPDATEWQKIRLHPVLGANSLREIHIDSFDAIADIILCHHENDNGTGYPCGLKGEAIPYESKIIRIADVFSAMISERPYKRAHPHTVAVEQSLDSIIVGSDDRGAIKTVLSRIYVTSV